MKRTTTTILAAAALVAGLGATAPASAQTDDATIVTAHAVVLGTFDGLRGNRHQLVLETVNGYVARSSYVRSYYCPSGASISPTWASSRCTHRSTFKLSNFAQNRETSLIGRISPTERSATLQGPVVGRSTSSTRTKVFAPNLSMYVYEGEEIVLKGTVDGNALQTSGRYAFYGRQGRG